MKRIKDKIKKWGIIASIALTGTSFYSGEVFDTNHDSEEVSKGIYFFEDPQTNEYAKLMSKNYIESIGETTTFEKVKEEYDTYKKSELEKILKEEKEARDKEKWEKGFYLTPDSLNKVIKQAYGEMKKEGKKWPNQFDSRLFRLTIRQESRNNVYAVSPTGYMGLGQVGFSLVETLRPDKWNNEFRDSITGEIDSLEVKRFLFNPVENVKLSLEGLEYISRFCAKYDPNWKQSSLETKRMKMLFCYNAGIGKARDYNFNSDNKELPKENIEYPKIILAAYNDPKVIVKL